MSKAITNSLPEPVSCFFCRRLMPPKDWEHRRYKEYIRAWLDKYGSLVDIEGNIGPHQICKSCADDIYGLVSEGKEE